MLFSKGSEEPSPVSEQTISCFELALTGYRRILKIVRSPSYLKGLSRGAWSAMEDMNLSQYIRIHSSNGWKNIPKKAGLKRCGKSCRLRWLNYYRPDIKHGNISPDEEELIIRFHLLLGNRWSLIAGRLPSRTDNEIKNYWNTHMGKKLCLSMNKSQPRTSENRRTRSKSPVPVQNPVFKSTTVKIKIVVRHCGIVRANGYNDEGCSNHISDEAFKLWNIQETIATTLHPMKAVPYHLSIVIPLNCLQSRTFGFLHSQFSSYSHIYVTSISIFIYRTYL